MANRSFKEYIADRFENELFAAAEKIILADRFNSECTTKKIQYPTSTELDKVRVLSVSANDLPEMEVEFVVLLEVQVDIYVSSGHWDDYVLICAFSPPVSCTLFSPIEILYCTFSYSLAQSVLLNWPFSVAARGQKKSMALRHALQFLCYHFQCFCNCNGIYLSYLPLQKYEALMHQMSEAEDRARAWNRAKVHESFAVKKLTPELLDEYVKEIDVHSEDDIRIIWK